MLLILPCGAQADDIQFQTLSADQTGIRAIFDHWYQVEMDRQGGPGKSHGWWPWGLRAFDYDGDGDLDLLASHHGTPHSIILKSLFKESGEHRFINATPELGLDNRDLPGADDRPWIWDFDGDGFFDIAGFSDESRPPSAWNQAGKQFTPTSKPFFNIAHPREVIDLNGDGYLDLDAGYKGQWFYLPQERSFQHDKSLRFPVPSNIPADLTSELAAVAKRPNNRFLRWEYLAHDIVGYDSLGYDPRPIDLNADGRPDLVIRGEGSYGGDYLGRYLLRSEDDNLADRTEALGLPGNAAPILIQDLTGDGRTDLLLVEKETGGLYLQDASGKFQRQPGELSNFLTRRGPYLIRAWKVDLDNDGDPDLVLSNPRLGQEAVFENRGEGRFAQVLSTSGWDANPIVIADFDHDGRLDLAIGGAGKERGKEITIFLNRTEQSGNYLQLSPRLAAPNPYAVGTVIEVFAPGQIETKNARPLHSEKAHPDGTPVHVGLGKHSAVDLRLTSPAGAVTVVRNVQGGQQLELNIPNELAKQ